MIAASANLVHYFIFCVNSIRSDLWYRVHKFKRNAIRYGSTAYWERHRLSSAGYGCDSLPAASDALESQRVT
eukprot:2167020-Amphidinium_carterae.1